MRPVKNQSTLVEKILELRTRYAGPRGQMGECSPESTPLRYYHYRCGICGRKTSTKGIMRWHLNRTHGIIIEGDFYVNRLLSTNL